MKNQKHTLRMPILGLLALLIVLSACSPSVEAADSPAEEEPAAVDVTSETGAQIEAESEVEAEMEGETSGSTESDNNGDEEDGETQTDPSTGTGAEGEVEVDIHCTETDPHPMGQSIADTFDVTYEEIMTWFCAGSSFDDILIALETSQEVDVPVDQLLEMHADSSWEVIWDDLGMTQDQ